MKTAFKCLNRDQRGITLIEMLVVVALFGILAAGILATISQVLTVNARTSSNMVALRQVQQAGDSVSRDVLQAELPLKYATSGSFSLNLTIPYFWDEGGTLRSGEYTVEYWLDGDELMRSESGGTPRVIARYLVPASTSFAPAGGGYEYKVMAMVGGQEQTRTYEIRPRVGS